MYFISVKPSYSQLFYSIPVLFPDIDSPFPKIIPNFWNWEWEAVIPGNGREREFPLTPGLQGCNRLRNPGVVS